MNFIVALVCAVSALRGFDMVMIMTGGGPYNSSTVAAYYMYEQAFLSLRYGYGAAIACVLFVLIEACVLMFLWRTQRLILPEEAGRCFPNPFPRRRAKEHLYRRALVASLAVWLLPILAVALTSVRPLEDINRGNIWGWPSKMSLVENYTEVLASSACVSSSSTAS